MNEGNEVPGARSVDGVEMRAKGDGHTWLYVPDRPRLERSEAGTPLLHVIEAGPIAFLQATIRLALPDADRDRILATLQATDPTVTDLVADAIVVERLGLQARTETWTTVAEGPGSGSVPWNAALSATLDAQTTAAIKAAINGEPGHARLVATFAVGGSPGSMHEASAAAEAFTRTTEGSAYIAVQADLDASVEATSATTREITADLSELFTAGR